MIKKRDIILFTSIAFAALALYLITALPNSGGKTAVVTVDGKKVAEYPLNTNTEVDIKSKNGVNRLVIRDGQAYIVYADCKNQVCVNHKEISKEGESIICVPHKTTVEIR